MAEQIRPMIARMWRGVVPAEKSDQYLDYLNQTGVKETRSLPGNRGVRILRRNVEDRTEFLFVSFWESYEVIRAFAGDDIERAVYYPEDASFLLEMEPHVRHYEIMVDL